MEPSCSDFIIMMQVIVHMTTPFGCSRHTYTIPQALHERLISLAETAARCLPCQHEVGPFRRIMDPSQSSIFTLTCSARLLLSRGPLSLIRVLVCYSRIHGLRVLACCGWTIHDRPVYLMWVMVYCSESPHAYLVQMKT